MTSQSNAKTPPVPTSTPTPKTPVAPTSSGSGGKKGVVGGASGFDAGEAALRPASPGGNERGGALAGVVGGARAPREDMLEATVAHDAMAGPDGIKTWNPAANEGKGAFELAAPGDRANGGDKRNFKGVGGGHTREQSIQLFKNLNNGKLTMEQVLALDMGAVQRISPIGADCSAKNILMGACQQSWHVAKHTLAESPEPRHQAVMRKLWEYRQWHHDSVLKKAQTEVNAAAGATGLSKWGSAGSASLTSDIDVNLKGSHTEKAVEVFNRLFKADGWSYESGVVYDVNVYALDFMHAPVGVKNAETGKTEVGKEGVRELAPAGGIKEEVVGGKKGEKDKDAVGKLEADVADQEVWSLLKVRMYMNASEWEAHKAALTPASPPEARTKKLATFAKVELRLRSYQKTLIDKMVEMAGDDAPGEVAKDPSKHGVGQVGDVASAIAAKTKKPGEDEHTVAEDAQMAASNRIYETKLAAIATLRGALAKKILFFNTQVKAGELAFSSLLQPEIHADLANLRTKLSEASLFSNEAYITDGAINHTVVGLQVGAPVSQRHSEIMNAVNENLGDSLKEIQRHSGTIGEAAYKAGKYMWRMCDASRNMDISSAEIEALYDVGYDLGNTIKSRGGDVEQASADLVAEKLGITEVPVLKAHVIKLGRDIQRMYNNKLPGHASALGAPVTKGKH